MKLQDGEEGSQKHKTICNGCHSEDEKGPRYISVTAKSGKLTGNGYVDYCQKCFLQLKDKASDKAQELVALDAKQGMEAAIVYSLESYSIMEVTGISELQIQRIYIIFQY